MVWRTMSSQGIWGKGRLGHEEDSKTKLVKVAGIGENLSSLLMTGVK